MQFQPMALALVAKQQTHHPETVAFYPDVLVQIQPSAPPETSRGARRLLWEQEAQGATPWSQT